MVILLSKVVNYCDSKVVRAATRSEGFVRGIEAGSLIIEVRSHPKKSSENRLEGACFSFQERFYIYYSEPVKGLYSPHSTSSLILGAIASAYPTFSQHYVSHGSINLLKGQ